MSTSSFHLTHLRHGRTGNTTAPGALARVRHHVIAHRNDVRAQRDLRLTLAGYYGQAAQAEMIALHARA